MAGQVCRYDKAAGPLAAFFRLKADNNRDYAK
jgi:hypothetical protein